MPHAVEKESETVLEQTEVEKPDNGEVKEKKQKKPAVKRIFTRKSFKKFSEDELRDGLKYLVENKMIPDRAELGSIKKLGKEFLISYCPTWAMANYFQAVLEQRELKQKNVPSLSEKQRRIMKKLGKHSIKNILACIKSTETDIKNTYNMKKEELNLSVSLHPNGVKILHAVRELEKRQEEELLEKKRKREEEAEAEKSEEVSSDSDDGYETVVIKKRKKVSKH